MKRLLEIDILRSLATVLLLLQHAGLYQFKLFGITLKTLFRTQIGFSLLGLFIFISGFLLGYSIKQKPLMRLGTYYLRRVSKLYPAYILAVLLFLVLLPVQFKGLDLLVHVFGLQILLAPTFSDPIITLWYFGLLILCLMIVPIGLKKFNNRYFSFIYLLTAFLISLAIHERFHIIEVRFFYFFWIFALGGMIGRYYADQSWLLMQPLAVLLSLIIFILTGYRLFKSQAAYYVDLHWGHISWANLYMLTFIHLAYLLASRINLSGKAGKLINWISRGSFFIYIFHRPVWAITLLPFSIAEGPHLFFFKLFIGSPLVIALSSTIQPLYERAVTNLRRSPRNQ
jgi:peptidoglycan/LPS O-acetylase OafA/YrhL